LIGGKNLGTKYLGPFLTKDAFGAILSIPGWWFLIKCKKYIVAINCLLTTFVEFSLGLFGLDLFSPKSDLEYRERWCVSLLCSEWEEVVPHRSKDRKDQEKIVKTSFL